MGIHLDSTLTIQTRRRFVLTAPANMEELRTKYKIMTNLWLLVQMPEPRRRLYVDLDKDTFGDFVDVLISEKNFLLERRINGVKMIIPQWEHCLNYEQELRNEAIWLTIEQDQECSVVGLPKRAPTKRTMGNAHRNHERRTPPRMFPKQKDIPIRAKD